MYLNKYKYINIYICILRYLYKDLDHTKISQQAKSANFGTKTDTT